MAGVPSGMTAKIVWLINFMISMVALGSSTEFSLPKPDREYVDAIYVEVGEIERKDGEVRYSMTCWARNHTDHSHQVTVTIVGFGRDGKPLEERELSGFVEVRTEIQLVGDGRMELNAFLNVYDWRVERVRLE